MSNAYRNGDLHDPIIMEHPTDCSQAQAQAKPGIYTIYKSLIILPIYERKYGVDCWMNSSKHGVLRVLSRTTVLISRVLVPRF